VPVDRVGRCPTLPLCRDHPRSGLLLLDGHSLPYRAFFALPVENFSTTTGQHTNAGLRFTSMLINVLRDEQPTHIGWRFDKSRQTFRLAEVRPTTRAKRNKDARTSSPASCR
jgi:DNA polymerase-1